MTTQGHNGRDELSWVIGKSLSQRSLIMLCKEPGTQVIWVDPIVLIKQAFFPEGINIINTKMINDS
jgi:hypothetical protein